MKNTAKKFRKSILPALALSLLLSACAGGNDTVGADAPDAGNDTPASAPAVSSLPVLAMSPYVLAGTDEGVADFTTLNASYESGYANDAPLNITPDFIRDEGSFSVYKYEKSNETFVVYEGAVYPVASGFGGDGVTSMALADLNVDNAYELYYGYSDDGTSFVKYFDPADKQEHQVAGSFPGQAIVMAADSGGLYVAAADSDWESMLSMTLTPAEVLARITNASGDIEMAKSAE